MANIYDEPINKHVDWGGDSSTGGAPVSGRQVQKFIKDSLEARIGETYYDTQTGLYLQFSDVENRNLYLTDRATYANLLLGSFDAPAPYVIYTESVSPTEKAILEGSTGNTLEFRFQVQDSTGSALSDGVKVVYTFNNSGNTRTATKYYSAGTGGAMGVASLVVDDYLSSGVNDISLKISGRNTSASKTLIYTWTVVSLQLSTAFEVSSPVAPGDDIVVPYTIKGLGTKKVQFWIDSVQYPVEDTIADAELSKTFYIPNTWSSGKHTLQIRAYITIGSEPFWSQTLYREFVISGSTGKWVTISYDFAAGTLIDAAGLNFVLPANQYEKFSAPWGYVASDLLDRTITWTLGGVQVAVREGTSGVLSPLSFVPTVANAVPQNLCAYIEGVVEPLVTYKMLVTENTEIHEETGAMALKLSAFGRYNSDADHASWTYGDIDTTFSGVEWTDLSGWNGQALVLQNGATATVNYKPFDSGHPAVSYGLTFEIEFETFNVDDEDAVVATVATGTHGIKITSNSATLTSDAGTAVKTNFKDSERVKLAFIVHPNIGESEKCLSYIQNNGILERAVSYNYSDAYTNSANIVLGGNGAGIKIYMIRSYYKALTTNQEFNNFVIDSSDVATKLEQNDVYVEGTSTVSVTKMQGILPVLLFTGPIHILLESTSKETTITGDFSFTNPQDPTRNWWGTGMQMKLQGTSSLRYPRKNFKIYMKKGNNPQVYDADGNVITDWAMKARAVPCHTFTLKADFSDSSCTHNSTIARMYGDIEPNAVLAGTNNHILRTPPQVCAYEGTFEQATGKPFPYDLRTTPDSFPMVMFYRESVDDDYTFAGQYNFLNDKGNEFVYGFRSIYANGDNPWDKTAPKLWDNVNTHCFEVLNNTDSTGLCEWTDSALFFVEDPQNPGHSYWEQTWESRYPEAEGTETKAEMDALAQSLYVLHSWMSSCYAVDQGQEGSLAKFYNEQADHLDLNKCASYYAYFMRFGAVDQVNKNMMITTYDGVHWFPIRYDNDTILGQRNDGRLIYDYTIDRQTEDPETGDYAYAGHASWFWNALEAQNNIQTYPQGFMTKYVPDIDASMYSAGLTYDATVQYFDVTTSDKWCERIYNDNGKYKYINPFISEGSPYLYSLQGKRQSHRHWWLRNRFDLYDAKFVTGEYSSKNINFTVPGTPQGSEIIFKAGKTNYYGWGINKVPQLTGVYKAKGDLGSFTISRQLAVGDPIYMYAANCIQELDLSDFCPYFTTLDVSGAYDPTIGTRLRKLILGDSAHPNSSSVAFGGFNYMSRLEYLDISGFQGNNIFDLTGLTSLSTFIATNSGLTLFTCPAGLNFNELRLPQTLQGITMDQVTWNASAFTFTPTNTLNYVSFNKMKGVNVRNFLETWITNIGGTGTIVGKTLNLSVPKDDPWENMDVQMMLDFARFEVHSIRGRFVMGRAITSEEMTALTNAYGPTVWDPNAPLVIDAVESVVIGCDKPVCLAGESAQFTAVAFPVGGIQHDMHFEISGVSPTGTPEDPIYEVGNAILHQKTGLLETTEDNTPDNQFTVFAVDETTGTADEMVYTVWKRSYPTSVGISGPVTVLTPGTYEFTTHVSPEGTTGTLQSFEWLVPTSTYQYLTIVSQTAQKLTLQVLSVPNTYDNITISVSLVYKNGQPLPAQKTFIAHNKTKIVDSSSNYYLATALNEVGVSASPLLAWDIEAYVWNQPLDLSEVEHKSQITTFLGSTSERVYRYFANCPKFNFSGLENLIQDFNLTSCTSLTEVDFSGTQVPAITFGPALVKANIPTVTRLAIPQASQAFDIDDITFNPLELTSVELTNCAFVQSTEYSDVFNWFYYEIYKKQVPSVLPEPTSTYYAYYNSNNSILYSEASAVQYNYYDDDIQTGFYELSTEVFNRVLFDSNINHITGIDTNCTEVDGDAVAGSTSLVTFKADSASVVYGEAFMNCSALVTVSLLTCTTASEADHFKNCSALKNVFAPLMVFQAGFGATSFYHSGIESISQAVSQPTTGVWLPALRTVPTSCFENCTILTDAQLPLVTTISTTAFKGCSRLVSGSIASCISLGTNVFESCTSLAIVTKVAVEDPHLLLNSSLTVLPNGCFKLCRALTNGVLDCINYGDECFMGCSSLGCIYSASESRDGLRIGNNSATVLGEKCFYQCGFLTQAIINFVHEIKAYCFASCTKLGELHTNQTAPTADLTCFGDGTDTYAYTGCDTGLARNLLYLIQGATGYGSAPWSDPLLNSGKCNFQITTEEASCHITYEATQRLTDTEVKPQVVDSSWDESTMTGTMVLNVVILPDAFFANTQARTHLQTFSCDCIGLGARVFYNCAALTEVVLDSCTSIGDQCFFHSGITAFDGNNITAINGGSHFRNCASLASVSFHNALTIPDQMFDSCTSLSTVDFASVRTFGYRSFYNCSRITEIDSPNCTFVGREAFRDCTSLASFDFSSVQYIGTNDPSAVSNSDYHCFRNTALTTVNAPNCTCVGRYSFSSCSHLETVNLPLCTAIGSSVFDWSTVQTVNLPALVSSSSQLFYFYPSYTSNLQSVTLSSLQRVNWYDFYNTKKLNISIGFPNLVEGGLGQCAFFNSGLAHITDLGAITSIPDRPSTGDWAGVFQSSGFLEDVALPSTLTYIGMRAFEGCGNLEDANIDNLNSVTYVGANAFRGCNKLEGVLNMPLLTTLGSAAFYSGGLDGIESLGTLTSIANSDGNVGVFQGCKATYAKLPKTVTVIGSRAFYGCPNLTEVNFYDLVNVTNLNWGAFYSGVITSAVSFPNLSNIENAVFYNQQIQSVDDLGKLTILNRPDNDYGVFQSSKIRSVVIPETMARMEYNNFRDCNQLRYITSLSNTPPVVDNSTGSSTWYGCNAKLQKVAVPAGFKEDYKTAWSYLTQTKFCELPYDDSDYTLVVYNFEDVTNPVPVLSTTTGVTKMEHWNGYTWDDMTVATTVTLTTPGYHKFRFITGATLDFIATANVCRVWTATNITSVVASAFLNASMLTEFHGTNVTTIGASAFSGCIYVEIMEIPALTTIADSCFRDMGSGIVGGAAVLKTLIFGQTQPQAPQSMDNPFSGIPDVSGQVHDCQTGDNWDWQGVTTHSDYYYWQNLSGALGWSRNPITINYHSAVEVPVPEGSTEVIDHGYDSTEQIGYFVFNTSAPTSNPFAGNTNVEVLWGDNQIYSLPTDFIAGCTHLRYVWFPTVTTLATGALRNAAMLRTVILPRLTAIPNDGFNGDSGLYDKIHFDRVVTVGDRAFYDCSNMHDIKLPVCTSVGDSAFKNTGIVSVDLPALQTVADNAFANIPAYEALLPACTSIGHNSFEDCASLITFEFGSTQPTAQTDSFTDIAHNGTLHHSVAFWDWDADGWKQLYNAGWNAPLAYFEYVASAMLVIDPTTHGQEITDHTYDVATGTGIIVISTVNPTKSLFYEQETLTEVTVSASIQSLPSQFFGGCINLTQINMNLGQITVATDTFSNVSATGYVRAFDYVDWNREAQGWSVLLGLTGGWDFDNRVLYYTAYEKAVLYTENEVVYHVYDSFLHRGAILMTSSEPSATPLRNNTQATEIHGLFTKLPAYFVAYCDARQIKFQAATIVSDYALYSCSNVLSVNLASAVDIHAYALAMNIQMLECVTSSAQIIYERAFFRDYVVDGIDFSHVIRIDTYAFYNCSTLSAVVDSLSLTIGTYAFQYCRALTTVNTPNITSLGTCAFSGCSALANVTMTSALVNISNGAFENCTSLVNVSFPTVQVVGNNAFENCTNLVQCLLPTATTAGYRSFRNCPKLETVGTSVITAFGSQCFESDSLLTNTFNFSNVVTVGDFAFNGCKSLSGNIGLPALTQSGTAWFYNADFDSISFLGNTGITTLNYNGNGAGTMARNFDLRSVVLPDGLTTMGATTDVETWVNNRPNAGTLGRCYTLRMVGPMNWQSDMEKLNYYAFANTRSLHIDVDMPNLNWLGNGIFVNSGITAVEDLGSITKLANDTQSAEWNSLAYMPNVSYIKLPSGMLNVGSGFILGSYTLRNLYVPTQTPPLHLWHDQTERSGGLYNSSSTEHLPSLAQIVVPCGALEEYYYWDTGVNADSLNYWSGTKSRSALVEGAYEETEWITVVYDVSASYGQPMTIVNNTTQITAMEVRTLLYNQESGQYTGARWDEISPITSYTFNRRPAGTGAQPRTDSGMRVVRFKTVSGLAQELAGITTIKRVYTPSAVVSANAFSGCTGLVTIKAPNAQSFGNSTFAGCTSLALIEVDAQPTATASTFTSVPAGGVVRIYGSVDFSAAGWATLTNWTSKDRTVVRLKSFNDVAVDDPEYYKIRRFLGYSAGAGLYEKGETATLTCNPGWTNFETPTHRRYLYDFIAWSDGETTQTHSPIVLNSDTEINAIVAKRQFTINIVEQNQGYGTISGGVYTVEYPNEGYFTWDNSPIFTSVTPPPHPDPTHYEYKFWGWKYSWGGDWFFSYDKEGATFQALDDDFYSPWHRFIPDNSNVITIYLIYKSVEI